MKYRKKPVEIEAVQLLPNIQSVKECYQFLHDGDTSMESDHPITQEKWYEYCEMVIKKGMDIETLEGKMHVSVGDYIIKGVKGEFYPCKPDIFHMTYEVEEDITNNKPNILDLGSVAKHRKDLKHRTNRATIYLFTLTTDVLKLITLLLRYIVDNMLIKLVPLRWSFKESKTHKMAKFESYNNVSDYIIAIANDRGAFVSNLELQKLTYYLQSYFLAAYNEPLFDNDFQAWVHGPVIPELYHQYKQFGYKPILREDLNTDYIDGFESKFKPDEMELIADVINFYMPKNGWELEMLTHAELPWQEARGEMPSDEPSTNTINKATMQKYYSQYIV